MMETFLSSRHYLGRSGFPLKLWTERVLQSLSKSVSADECKTSEVCQLATIPKQKGVRRSMKGLGEWEWEKLQRCRSAS